MNKMIALLALGLMTVGSVACSSAPKQEEQAPAAEVAAPVEQAPVDTTSNTTAKPDLSLGAGSSGRGH